jgi:tellurite resistance protein TerC
VSEERQGEHRSRWGERLAERRERHVERSRLYRIMFVVAGVIVTLVGIGMLVLPGPALVVIPVGLAMLAMEFAWAENVLEKALTQAEKAQQTAKEASPMQKAFTAAAIVLAIAAVVVWAAIGNIPIVPDP